MDSKKSVFRFKQFKCSHVASSMKIGVDAVLLGAWADVNRAKSILDVGTGCGVIALMCAQRNPEANILAIDIDINSVKEASLNFMESQWRNRLNAELMNYMYLKDKKYDLIISNPPFFNSGVKDFSSARMVARHDSSLSPLLLLTKAKELLLHDGIVTMIVPFDRKTEVNNHAGREGFILSRCCEVKGNYNALPKRIMLEYRLNHNGPCLNEEMVIEQEPGTYSESYRQLCSDFYLAF
ncbi:MAG: methyltransferase [Bacteroidales bacterium]|nr:methyltransferase [Bacteroidales bacterium]